MIANGLKTKLPPMPNSHFHILDCRDAATAFYNAADLDIEGRFAIGGEGLYLFDMFETLKSVNPRFRYSRQNLPKLAIPLLTPLDWLNSVATGQPRQIDISMVRDLWALDQRISTQSAEKNLGFEARPSRETLADTFNWIESRFVEGRPL